MNKIITAGCAAVATFAAVAVPTKAQLEKARPVVEKTTKAELAAYKAGEKTAQKVAAAHIAYAQKTEGEAAKYLLLQGAFKLYARSGEYDLAADTIVAMNREIKDLPPAVIAEIVGDELRYVSDDKAPRLVAMLKEAKRTIAQDENTRKVSKVEYQAKTLKQVRKDVAQLFPGWSLDTEVQHLNIESADSGLHASHRGQNNVICLHPVGEGKSAILSRSVTLSDKNPCLFLKVASAGIEDGDFLLTVRVNGKEALPNRLIYTPDFAPWEDVAVPLSAWRGQSVKIEIVLTANGWWYEFPYLSRLEVGESNGEAKSTVDGHLSFCFAENRGRREIVGANGQRFMTKWSGCSADTVYAYRDHVELVGVSDTLRDFPTSSADFVSLDWEQRAPTIKKGAFVVFLNAANEFLCVRVDDVKSKSRGDKEDKLSLTYRVYEADVASSKSIHEAHRIARSAYSIVGKDQGSGVFRYAANSGRFLFRSSQGQWFDTMWSSCSADSVYAYGDYVGAVSACQNWTSFPAMAEEFQPLDWSKRSVTVAKGASVVFRNKSNQYLCVRISDVKSKSRGDSDDLISFDFKIYNTSDMVVGKKTPRPQSAKNRTTIQSIIDGMIKVPGKDFWLSETELTQGQWEAVMGYNLSAHKGANLPVENVSRDDCDVFIEKLNQEKEVHASQFEFRLPELDEWKYAAWAGSAGRGAWIKPGVVGDVCEMAWVKGNSSNQTHAVATKLPNAFGFYDMLGNVWEWLAGEAGVPQGHGKGALKGTSFGYASDKCTWNANWYLPKSYRNSTVGLRLAAHIRYNKASVSARPRQRGSLLARRKDMKDTTHLQATVDGYTWSYRVDNGEAMIEAKKDGQFVCAVSPNPTGDVVIPSLLNGMKVTSIGQEAFCHYKGPKSVKIPEGVKNIEWCAFYMCTNLTSVTLPTGLNRIGHGAFAGCGRLNSVVIPESVTNIAADAFRFCRGLKSVNIPSGVKRINECTFDLCNSLTSIEIPNGVESIDRAAFYNCWELKSVTIPRSVRVIGPAAFNRCHGLRSLTIGSGVKEIGEVAFEFCGGLTEVTMLGERPKAPKDVFKGCNNLVEIHVPANEKSWAGMKEWQGKKLVFDAKEK